MYYLQSRYYDPEVGRFLNADAFASTGQGLLGNNMFAYCGNNPANYADPLGYERLLNQAERNAIEGMVSVAIFAAVGCLATVSLQDQIQEVIRDFDRHLQQIHRDIVDYAHASMDYLADRYADNQPRIHHVIPQGLFSKYGDETVRQMQYMHSLLASVGIDINDPENLIAMSQGTHKRIHTKSYIDGLFWIMSQATPGDEWSVREALFWARMYASSFDAYSSGY